MRQLIVVRHGQSEWNKINKFTGWKDVGLTEQGIAEAQRAAKLIREEAIDFRLAHTSVLKRAIKTLWIILEELDLMWKPVLRTWRLNERHYGKLQGLDKSETAKQYGADQVKIWRRSFDTPPPLLEPDSPESPINDPKYSEVPATELPLGESLKQTIDRISPYWNEKLAPLLRQNTPVLIVAHGNSIRALIQYLEKLDTHEITDLNIPTGIPFVYKFGNDLKPIERRYLGDPELAKKEAQAVANQANSEQ